MSMVQFLFFLYFLGVFCFTATIASLRIFKIVAHIFLCWHVKCKTSPLTFRRLTGLQRQRFLYQVDNSKQTIQCSARYLREVSVELWPCKFIIEWKRFECSVLFVYNSWARFIVICKSSPDSVRLDSSTRPSRDSLH